MPTSRGPTRQDIEAAAGELVDMLRRMNPPDFLSAEEYERLRRELVGVLCKYIES